MKKSSEKKAKNITVETMSSVCFFSSARLKKSTIKELISIAQEGQGGVGESFVIVDLKPSEDWYKGTNDELKELIKEARKRHSFLFFER